MKGQDLTIGNWYHSVKFNTPVKLTAEDIYNLVADADGASIDHYIDEMFKPISLTESWLVKFGLKKSKFDGYEIRLKRKGYEFTYYLYYDKGEMYTGNQEHFGCFQVKHVHQLQNLYRSLTDEELEINPLSR